MSEMVVRVAKAIADAEGQTVVEGWDGGEEAAIHMARAAIAAMREPTMEQMSRAIMSFPPWGGHGEPSAPSEADMWRAMIDAALSEAAKER